VHAPAVEAEVIREPRYEPVYLYGGAEPVAALRSKFLQAEPSPVDHVFHPGAPLAVDGRALETFALPGHSLAQAGVRAGGVLFAADAFFGVEALAKHGAPYLVDAARMRESVDAVGRIAAHWYVPGHGPALEDPRETLAANAGVLDRGLAWLAERLRGCGPAGTEDLLVEFAEAMGMRIADPPSYVLNRAALLGFLTSLERAGDARVVIEGGRWLWTAG
jgi:glyoxylase-like metal-dependent hydrolase (beta-lactamase superfamily II)